jgi:hypothetical protein
MLAKATTSCIHFGQVGHFVNRCPDRHQQSNPIGKTCHNFGERGHFEYKICNPCQPLTPAPIANSAPNHQVNSTTSIVQQQL